MSRKKDSLEALLADFAHTEFSADLLWVLYEKLRRGRPYEGRWEVRLDELVERAATNAAYKNPEDPLDQRRAHKAYFALFKQLEHAGLGVARSGRRGKPTRFELAPAVTSAEVTAVFQSARLRQKLEPREKAQSRREQEELAAVSAALARPDATASDRRPSADQSAAAVPEALRRDDVVKLLKRSAAQARRLGVRELSLFGSLARDEARPDSDVDLLVEFDGPVTSQKFFDTKFFLEDLLGRRVDLVTEAAVHPGLRKTIAPELIRVA